MNSSFLDSPLRSEASTIESDVKTTKKYNRISGKTRDSLLTKIFFHNKKIKIAAKELNMNYSTAKTILHLYRKKMKKGQKIKEEKRCFFKSISPADKKIELNITQGGKDVPYMNVKMLGKKIVKEEKLKPIPIKFNFNEEISQRNCFNFVRFCEEIKRRQEEEIFKNKISLIEKEYEKKLQSRIKKNVILIQPIAN